MSLIKLRNEIDGIDDEISSLLVKRLTVVDEIAKEKKKTDTPTFDQKREEEIIDRLTKGKNGEQKAFIEKIYKEVFNASREYQNGKK